MKSVAKPGSMLAPHMQNTSYINVSRQASGVQQDTLVKVLREVAHNEKNHEAGEIIGLVKIVMAQVFLIRAPVYAQGGNIMDPDSVL